MQPPTVEQVVETALDRDVRSCEPAKAGRMAETYLLTLAGPPGRVVCKFGGSSVRTRDVVEPPVVRLVDRTTDLPVPTVLETGRLPEAGRRWAVYEFRDGTTPTPFDRLGLPVREALLRDVGSALARLHATHQFEQAGGLARAGDDLRICTPRGLHVPGKARELLQRMPGRRWTDPQPVLTHGDLYPGNLLVEDGELTALLDWGNAHVTTAGYALARAELRFVDWFRPGREERASLRAALRAGYRRHRTLPRDYPRLATLHKTLWLVQSGERHLRHTLTSRGRRQLLDHARSVFTSLRG
jgi:aminoglycoside phosphotransferase (APT) family kinase protein